MRKAAVLAAALGLVVLTAAVAQAEICYRLNPFSDVLRLSIHIDDGAVGSAHQNVFGNWQSSAYSLPSSGARELNRGSTAVRRLGILSTNNTGFFGGNPICSLDGIPGSAWRLTCVGGLGARFINNGTPLAPIGCGGLAPSSANDGPAAGDGPGQ